MTAEVHTARYGRCGWHYDVLGRQYQRPGELRFYTSVALAAGGPCLEVACGSARVLAAVYATGLEAWGADAEPAMLELAEARLAGLRAESSTLAEVPYHLLNQPLQALAVPARFGSILLPLEAFRLLRSREEQERFLAASADHLATGGVLALDLTLPSAGLPKTDWLPAVGGPGGETVQARAWWEAEGEDVVEVTEYRTVDPSGRVTVESFRDAYRKVEREELRALLLAAGFKVTMESGSFTGRPYARGDTRLVVAARRAG